MNNPILIPFIAEHILSLINRDVNFKEEFRLALEKERGGPAFTAIFDSKIIGCAGVIIPWEGVGIAWTALNKDIELHKFWMARVIKRILKDVIKFLGFTREIGMAKKYTPDKLSAVRYELIKD